MKLTHVPGDFVVTAVSNLDKIKTAAITINTIEYILIFLNEYTPAIMNINAPNAKLSIPMTKVPVINACIKPNIAIIAALIAKKNTGLFLLSPLAPATIAVTAPNTPIPTVIPMNNFAINTVKPVHNNIAAGTVVFSKFLE